MDGCAGGCDGRGSAPAPPRFIALGPPAWGGSGVQTKRTGVGKILAPPWRIGQCGDATRAPSAGPYGTGGVFGRRLLSFSLPSQDIDEGDLPHPSAGGPNALNLGGTGAEPLSSPPPAKLSLHLLWWPVCQPRVAAGRLGASGGWRLAAWLALEWLRVGCRNA